MNKQPNQRQKTSKVKNTRCDPGMINRAYFASKHFLNFTIVHLPSDLGAADILNWNEYSLSPN